MGHGDERAGGVPVLATLGRRARAFGRDERGVTAIEYALIAGFLVVCLVAALPSITTALSTSYGTIAGYFP